LALRHALKWGLLLVVLAADSGPSAAATVGDGQRAYDNGRFEEARRIWGPLAEAGDAEAQVRLALLFDLGQGVPEDRAAAYLWYRRAAEAGRAQAQFNVAVMQDSGVVGPRNPAEAAKWYAKAGAQGHHRAQYNLAQLYSTGDGVPRDLAQARAWYRAAADGGLTAAADKLAEIERDARSGSTSSSEPAAVVPRVLTVNAPTNVSEAAGELVVRLELSRPVDTPVTVIYSTLDGDALDGFDYRAKQGVLSLSKDTPRSELRTTLVDDDQPEADETFYVFVTTIPQNVIVTEKWTTVVIHDDEQRWRQTSSRRRTPPAISSPPMTKARSASTASSP
jgi:Calx-beta domain/Sel1 repeat